MKNCGSPSDVLAMLDSRVEKEDPVKILTETKLGAYSASGE
jgi:hypothetical protein